MSTKKPTDGEIPSFYGHTEEITRPWRLRDCVAPSLLLWVAAGFCLNLYLYDFSCSQPKTQSLHVCMLKDFLLWIGLKLGEELEWKQPSRILWDDWKAYQLMRMCGVSWCWCMASRQCVTCRPSPYAHLCLLWVQRCTRQAEVWWREKLWCPFEENTEESPVLPSFAHF